MKKYLALDIGGTYIKYGTLQEDGKISNKNSIKTERNSKEKFIKMIEDIHESLTEEISGITISMPGIIDTESGMAVSGGSLNFIDNTPLANELEQLFKVPVTISNDGKCAAMAEHWIGSLRSVTSGIVIVFGSGIGGGIIINNHVIKGSHDAASEFSCMISNYSNPSLKNYWGANNSTKNMLRKYCMKKSLDEKDIDGHYFIDKLENNEKEAIEVFDDFTRSVASGIYSLQSILDVEVVAIGGGISERSVVIDGISKAVDMQFNKYKGFPVIKPNIVSCTFRNDSNMIGALKFHLNRMEETNE